MAALASALVSQGMFGALVGTRALQAARPLQRAWPNAEDRALAAQARRLLERVPAQGAVVAGPGLLAPLATRPVVHALHHVVTGVYTFSRQPMPIPDFGRGGDRGHERRAAPPARRSRDGGQAARADPAEPPGRGGSRW
jgi:hypothetical protein